MKAPLSWLKAYVDIDAEPRELAHRLTLAGIEVDGVEVIGEGWDQVIVGQVTSVDPHPNADRLKLATVDTGAGSQTVVCGAPNVAAGQKIAFASVGAMLIDAHTGERSKLKPAKIRGVESKGMVCSERELGLSDEHEGILVLPDDAQVGLPLGDYMGDVIFDIAVTPNRPDCLSMLGIAREIAAQTGREVSMPELEYAEGGDPIEAKTSVEIRDPDLCPRYIATVVTGVKIAPSPKWIQDRLMAFGMRPINNVVDISNYVMVEFGQPLHAFDYDLLEEHRIVVRRAGEGETITTIDGDEQELTPEMLVIADASRAVALAGVMGGSDSEIGEGTTNVLLESAAFNQVNIRRTSQFAGLRSESSARFDKGLSRELPMYASRRATQLLVEVAGGTAAKGAIDVYPGRLEPRPVRLTAGRTRAVLGLDIDVPEMEELLRPLGFTTSPAGRDSLDVTPPYWRTDVAIEEDLIEELVRVKGYDAIPTTTLSGHIPSFETAPLIALKEQVRDALSSMGLVEIKTYSLTSPEMHTKAKMDGKETLRVVNPMSAELEELRLSLRGGLLRTLEANQRLQEEGLRLYELGRVYHPTGESLPTEREMLAVVLSGPSFEPHWHGDPVDLDFFDAKGVVEALLDHFGLSLEFRPGQDDLLHPGRTAEIIAGGRTIGLLGELHPSSRRAFELLDRPAALFELDLEQLLASMPEKGHVYEPIARHPGVLRDLAIVVDQQIPADQVARIIAATPLVQRARLFDMYTGERVPAGKKSLAYRVTYQSPGRTLTADEADKAQAKLLGRLERELGAKLRG